MLENFPFDSLTFTVVENKVGGDKTERHILVQLFIKMYVIRNNDIDKNFVNLFNALSAEGYPRGTFVEGPSRTNSLVYSWMLPVSLMAYLYDTFKLDPRCDVRHLKYNLDKVKT